MHWKCTGNCDEGTPAIITTIINIQICHVCLRDSVNWVSLTSTNICLSGFSVQLSKTFDPRQGSLFSWTGMVSLFVCNGKSDAHDVGWFYLRGWCLMSFHVIRFQRLWHFKMAWQWKTLLNHCKTTEIRFRTTHALLMRLMPETWTTITAKVWSLCLLSHTVKMLAWQNKLASTQHAHTHTLWHLYDLIMITTTHSVLAT